MLKTDQRRSSSPEQTRTIRSDRTDRSRHKETRADPSRPKQAREDPNRSEKTRTGPIRPEQSEKTRTGPRRPEQAREAPNSPEKTREESCWDGGTRSDQHKTAQVSTCIWRTVCGLRIVLTDLTKSIVFQTEHDRDQPHQQTRFACRSMIRKDF